MSMLVGAPAFSRKKVRQVPVVPTTIKEMILSLSPTLYHDYNEDQTGANLGTLGNASSKYNMTVAQLDIVGSFPGAYQRGFLNSQAGVTGQEIHGPGTAYSLGILTWRANTTYAGFAGIRSGYPNEAVFLNTGYNGGFGENRINVEHFLSDGSSGGGGYFRFKTGQWYLFVMTREGDKTFFYRDNAILESQSEPVNSALAVKNQSSAWKINNDGGSNEDANSRMAFDFALDRAMTVEEIQQLWALCVSDYGITDPTIPDLDSDIATLAGATSNSVWYDPSDLSTVWQDTAGTVPASANDPVARIDDKSGNGHHATQATVGSRPILRTDGRYAYLEFDGTDDFMDVPTLGISGSQNRSLFIAASTINNANCILFSQNGKGGAGTAERFTLRTDSGGDARAEFQSLGNTASSSNYQVVDRAVVGVIVDGSTVNDVDVYYEQNVAVGTAGTTTLNTTDVNNVLGRADAMYGRMGFRGMIMVDSAISGTDLDNVRDWCKSRFGEVF